MKGLMKLIVLIVCLGSCDKHPRVCSGLGDKWKPADLQTGSVCVWRLIESSCRTGHLIRREHTVSNMSTAGALNEALKQKVGMLIWLVTSALSPERFGCSWCLHLLPLLSRPLTSDNSRVTKPHSLERAALRAGLLCLDRNMKCDQEGCGFDCCIWIQWLSVF